MADSLVQAYLPLVLWTGLGFLLLRFLPESVVPKSLPRGLGRCLYWVGVPLEILALARQTQFSAQLQLAPLITIAALVVAWVLAWLSLQAVRWTAAQPKSEPDSILPDPLKPLAAASTAACPWQDRARRGSFILSSIVGNTGFVGLAIAPVFIDPAYASWLVLYSVTQNVVGTYGVGVFLASFYGRSLQKPGWTQLQDVLTVPSLWAFAIGFSTRTAALPAAIEQGLEASVWVVIPAALLLMGMRLSQLRGWASLRLALVPTLIKVVILPLLVAGGASMIGLQGDARLAIVLMAGMPSAFAGLILAEEYELDRELIASSIVLTTAMLLPTIPLWLLLFQ